MCGYACRLQSRPIHSVWRTPELLRHAAPAAVCAGWRGSFYGDLQMYGKMGVQVGARLCARGLLV